MSKLAETREQFNKDKTFCVDCGSTGILFVSSDKKLRCEKCKQIFNERKKL